MARDKTKQRLTAGEVRDLMEEEHCVLVDVREGWERARGQIRGSQHVPMRALRRESREWAVGDPVVLICKSGARTRRAATMLRKMGFSHVTDLAGGMDSWEAAGLEIERDPAAARALTLQMRLLAAMLILAGFFVSHWWPPAIYLSEVLAIGLGMSLLTGWFGAGGESSGVGCQGGGGG